MSVTGFVARSLACCLLVVAGDQGIAAPHVTASPDDYVLDHDLHLSTGQVLPTGTRWYRPPDIDRLRRELEDEDFAGDAAWARQVVFGYEILTRTYATIGEERRDGRPPQATGRVLSCTNCHAQAGTVPHAWPYFRTLTYFGLREEGDNGVYFGGLGFHRDARIRARDCIQECGGMVIIDADSPEMDALIAWMRVVRDGIYDGEGLLIPEFKSPRDAALIPGATTTLFPDILDMRADPEAGETIYRQRCAACHGNDGMGIWGGTEGYLFPPLAGGSSFSQVGGPILVPVGAAFLHRNMPLSDPGSLTPQQALDVMGFVSTMPRAAVWWQDHFYRHDPCSRPPWMQLRVGVKPKGFPFSAEQAQFGPWRPIAEWLASAECKAKNPTTRPVLDRDFDPRHPR
jgi:thiosulfate dehydrogenase